MNTHSQPQAVAGLETQFMTFRETWWPEVEQFIGAIVDETTTPGAPLRRMITYHFQTGGKRLRAILPLMIAGSLGTSPQKVLPFAAACELLHNASLIHDDIQDGDSTRRGNPTAWKKFGMPQAINLGDAMIALTLLVTDKLDVDAALRERAKSRVLREMLRVIDGQAMELEMTDTGTVDLDGYMRMVEGKTSSLFSLPVGGAALLSGTSKAVETALVDAAAQIGILFQIQDDIVDLYGEKGRETPGGDIREGKRSILVVHYLQHASAADAAWLTAILDKPTSATTQADVDAVKDAFEAAGSLDFALSELDRRRVAALALPDIDRKTHAPTITVLTQACKMFLRPIAKLQAARAAA